MKTIKPSYDPPAVVRGNSRWYIKFYATTTTGERQRFRFTFNLNRIHNLQERDARAEDLRQKLKWWLEQGMDPEKFDERKVIVAIHAANGLRPEKQEIPLRTSLDNALKLVCAGKRPTTIRSYESICSLMIRFFDQFDQADTPIGDFSVAMAGAYLDHCLIDRGVGNNTYNNNLRDARVIFNVLKDREYIETNPFDSFKYRRKEEKKRRRFFPEEGRVVVEELAKSDRYRIILYGLILQYTCSIRPAELLRLRFRNFDFSQMLIRIEGKQEKNHRKKVCTIPTQFYSYFLEPFWLSYPANYFVFGQNLQPHPTKSCGERTMGNRHRKILLDLQKRGLLSDIEGLSWYSWKDTGLTEMINQLGADPARKQANHSTESMTRRYYHEHDEDSRIRQFSSDLFSANSKK